MMTSLCQVNIELSSRCQKNCGFCGRRQYDRIHGEGNYGDIEWATLKTIEKQLPNDIIIATHWNGESMLFPRYGAAIKLLKKRNRFIYTVTNGQHLIEKASEIIGNLDGLSVSIVENDPKDISEKQYEILREFMTMKGYKKPYTTVRFVGNIQDEDKYVRLGMLPVRRTVHLPEGSIGYRNPPMVPEHGLCRDLIQTLAIDRFGNISVCVRFDPSGELILGNISEMTLDEAWNSPKRLKMVRLMKQGRRSEIKFCSDSCHFWGVPTQ